MKKQIIIVFIILIIVIDSIIFFFIRNNSNEEETLLSKTEKEIEYIEENIILMMNSLNQITFSDAVLIEEKIQSTKSSKSENNEQSQNTEDSNQGTSQNQGQNQGNSQEGGSQQSSSNSQSSSGSSSQNKQNAPTTKYEITNNSILTRNTDNIDWDTIKSNTENMHSMWSTLLIDLHSLNVNQDDILNFSTMLDQITINSKDEDKVTLLNNLASLYAFLPSYKQQIYKENNNEINIDYAKSCVLNSYALSEQNKWDEVNTQTAKAVSYFTNIMNSVDENRENQNKITKVYVLLNELNNSVSLNDKEVFLIKYKNAMEELTNI